MAGNTREVFAEFRRNGALSDPDSVTLTVSGAASGSFVYPGTLTRKSLGVFSALVYTTTVGVVRCQWDCVYNGSPSNTNGRTVFAFSTH